MEEPFWHKVVCVVATVVQLLSCIGCAAENEKIFRIWTLHTHATPTHTCEHMHMYKHTYSFTHILMRMYANIHQPSAKPSPRKIYLDELQEKVTRNALNQWA